MDECKPLPMTPLGVTPPGVVLGVAAQVEFESKFESDLKCFSFKRLVPGTFNTGLIGSTCTALPGRGAGQLRKRRLRPGPLRV